MKKVIIIGAGTAGLAVGSYLQANGYQTEIFELHSMSGGLCTAWKRKNFVIDGCLHWLTDVRSTSDFYQLYLETGAMKKTTYYFTPEVLSVYRHQNFTFKQFTNLDDLAIEIKRITDLMIENNKINHAHYQADCNYMLSLINTAKQLYDFTYPIKEITRPKPRIHKLLPWVLNNRKALAILRKYRKKTVADLFTPLITSEFRHIFRSFSGIPDSMAAFVFFIYLAGYGDQSFVYTSGGSLTIAEGMEEKYKKLGGKIHFKSPIEKIILKQNNAVGVCLSNGSQHFADYIISAADGFQTINHFVPKELVATKYHDYIEQSVKFDSIIQVSFCINKDFSNFDAEALYIDTPISNIEGITATPFRYFIDTPPKGFLHEKQTVIKCTLSADYHFFSKLKETPNLYQHKKKEIKDALIQHCLEHFDITYDDITYVDIATPTTFFDYTKNYLGSFEGIISTPDNFTTHFTTIDDINRLFLVGQWWNPGGGIPNSILSGRRVAQLICKKDQKKFIEPLY